MTSRLGGFNVYLVTALGVLLAGCASPKDPNDRLSTLLRVQLETLPSQMIPPQTIAVYRSNPLTLQVESLYLLTEENVVRAEVVNQMGTYALQIEFDRWAVPLLEHNSSTFQGRRLAFQAQWGPKHEHTRWLAAPRMERRIVNGVLTFTPDASLEECYQIVAGLNNNARKVRKPLEW